MRLDKIGQRTVGMLVPMEGYHTVSNITLLVFPPWLSRNTKWPFIWIAAKWSVSPNTPASHRALILHAVVPRTCTHAEVGTHGVVQSWIPTPKQ